VPTIGDTLSQDDTRDAKRRTAPHLLLELECARPFEGPAHYRLQGVERVQVLRGGRRYAALEGPVLQVRVPDNWISGEHAEFRRAGAAWEVADLGSKNGTLLNGARVQSAPLADGDLLQLGRTFFRFRAALPAEGPALLESSLVFAGPAGLRTLSPAFASLLAQVAALAPARTFVLLRGETGTGKEVLARALHTLSGRQGQFVAVNCGAIPEKLVEGELFGHKRGAFSGADQEQPGLVRTADGGTLFLDEIGDLPLPAQAALLRVLQESEVRPVGAARPVHVDLRVVSATHRDLDALVEAGTFRADLLARLDGVTLELPPLRERPEDVPLLIAQVLRKLAPERPDLHLSPEAAEGLLRHDWPLNVRELEQALSGALALSGTGALELQHLPRALREAKIPKPARPPPQLKEADQKHCDELVALLREHKGNISAVARAVGKARTQVQRWVARYGLDASRFRG
jgi:transcriptional regulator with GAF, ATPase, and Fis domain